jgi:N-acetyl-anhydromuramyl-L-alanine amidase AmpD
MRSMRFGSFAAGIACLLAGCVAPSSEPPAPRVAVGGDSPLVAAFEKVAYDTGVPAEVLASLAYVETRMQLVDTRGHDVERYGIFGLSREDLAAGALLAGVSDEAARTDALASIRAGAALLRAQAPDAITTDDFLAALEPQLRAQVTATLARGADGRDAAGRAVVLPAHGASKLGSITQALGYAGAEWTPASTSNYQVASRTAISNVVIHTTEGSYAGTLSWFKNPQAQVSAHYVVRSTDGHVAQMVDEKNIAWHDKCFNTTTVGIEHEGFVADPKRWYTETMYSESAKVTAYLCDKYGIRKDKGPIIGHDTAPDCSDHDDPGTGWDWNHYIDLVRVGGSGSYAAAEVVVDAPHAMVSGERATVKVTITNSGSSAWDLDITRLGTAQPHDRDSAFFADGDWISPSRATAVDTQVRGGETGTFTFEIVAPRVSEPTVYDETFQLVEEGVAWFGPDVHVVTQVTPDGSSGGCSSTNGGSGGFACGIVALGAFVSCRRRRSRRVR